MGAGCTPVRGSGKGEGWAIFDLGGAGGDRTHNTDIP